MPLLLPYDGKAPRLAPSVFLAEGTVVTGDALGAVGYAARHRGGTP